VKKNPCHVEEITNFLERKKIDFFCLFYPRGRKIFKKNSTLEIVYFKCLLNLVTKTPNNNNNNITQQPITTTTTPTPTQSIFERLFSLDV